MNTSKPWMKVLFIIVLFLILLPLVLFALMQFVHPVPVQNEPVPAESSDSGSDATRERRANREKRTVRKETTVIESEPTPVWEIGAISTDPTRKTKQAIPYEPGTVPGDSGVMVQYAGSPDDMMSGPVPPPPDDLWGGEVLPPIPPENMRGIGGVRRIDPNDPFFRQDIPNPFAN